MGTFTININADATYTTGAYIQSITRINGRVDFVINGATISDDLTLGVTLVDTVNTANATIVNSYGAYFFSDTFSPYNTGVESTEVVTYNTSPRTYSIIFYENPTYPSVLVTVRIISSTGSTSIYNQNKSIDYSFLK